jgi:hypothetical protein
VTAVRRWLLPALLVVGAALFVVGTSSEHRETGAEATPAASTPAGEAAEGGAPAEPASAEIGSSAEAGAEGKVLGINRESKGIVAVAAVVSVALAALAWAVRRRPVFIVIAAFAVVFAVFDIAEMLHQIDVSHSGLAVLAAAIAVVHLAAAAIAGRNSMTAAV